MHSSFQSECQSFQAYSTSFQGTFNYCTLTGINETALDKVDCNASVWEIQDGVNVTAEWKRHEFNFDTVFHAMMTLFVVMTFEGWPG